MRYGVAPSFWGKGIAPEAAKAIMAWAISQRGTTRFIAETEKANTRSAGVLRKLGFVESGVRLPVNLGHDITSSECGADADV